MVSPVQPSGSSDPILAKKTQNYDKTPGPTSLPRKSLPSPESQKPTNTQISNKVESNPEFATKVNETAGKRKFAHLKQNDPLYKKKITVKEIEEYLSNKQTTNDANSKIVKLELDPQNPRKTLYIVRKSQLLSPLVITAANIEFSKEERRKIREKLELSEHEDEDFDLFEVDDMEELSTFMEAQRKKAEQIFMQDVMHDELIEEQDEDRKEASEDAREEREANRNRYQPNVQIPILEVNDLPIVDVMKKRSREDSEEETLERKNAEVVNDKIHAEEVHQLEELKENTAIERHEKNRNKRSKI